MSTPNTSGIYIATLLNEIPIYSQAGDPRNENAAIRVNKENVKIGKAKNLSAREKNYQKTFGEKNVIFHPIILTEDFSEAEKVIFVRLKKWQAINPNTKRKVEWLQGISASNAINISLSAIEESQIRYTLSSHAIMEKSNKNERIAQSNSSNLQETISNINFGFFKEQLDELKMPGRRSPAVAFILTLFFGPFGAIYGSLLYGFLLISVFFISITLLDEAHWGPIYLVLWFASLFLGIKGAIMSNNKIRKALNDKNMSDS